MFDLLCCYFYVSWFQFMCIFFYDSVMLRLLVMYFADLINCLLKTVSISLIVICVFFIKSYCSVWRMFRFFIG
jgi:hypothetical protein